MRSLAQDCERHFWVYITNVIFVATQTARPLWSSAHQYGIQHICRLYDEAKHVSQNTRILGFFGEKIWFYPALGT